MTGNYEYSRSNRENLPLQFQSKLSKKLQTFSLLCLIFCNLHEISNAIKKKKEKKKEPHRASISEVIDSGICAYLNE